MVLHAEVMPQAAEAVPLHAEVMLLQLEAMPPFNAFIP